MLRLSTAVLSALLAQELVITRPLWYGPQPQSPSLPKDGFALELALLPASAASGPTVALLGALRLPGRYAGVYGGRISGAVQIVALDLDTGQVYHALAERPGAVPLAAVMKPEWRPEPGEAAVEVIETYFNADLRAHLGMPPTPANLAVFLWLDEMTSPVRLAQLPGPQGQLAPPARTPDVRLTLAHGASPGRLRMQASGASKTLTVLALHYRNRALKWRRVPLPKQAPKSAEAGTDLDVADLLGAPGGRQKTFLVACAGQALSNVLVVNSP